MGVTNFTVVEEQDYPPVANAGSPVLLHLPTQEVTLWGGDSRDDKGIVKYEWSKVEGKAVDIMVIGGVVYKWVLSVSVHACCCFDNYNSLNGCGFVEWVWSIITGY